MVKLKSVCIELNGTDNILFAGISAQKKEKWMSVKITENIKLAFFKSDIFKGENGKVILKIKTQRIGKGKNDKGNVIDIAVDGREYIGTDISNGTDITLTAEQVIDYMKEIGNVVPEPMPEFDLIGFIEEL